MMANSKKKKGNLSAKSADEIKAAFEFLPLVQDFIDNCMVNGANTKLIARFQRQSETKLDETLQFIKDLPLIDKSIHELRQKRDILKQELKRKKNVK